MLDMAKELLTVRLEAGKIRELDKLALGLERDRTYVVSQAIDAYLDVQRWQIEYVESAMRDADAGQFASPAEVKSAFARLRRKSKAR
jgi:predicted transcriptional regulator